MDWDAYRYFLAVAQHGSLSAAARCLGVTQPTVGRKIERMEECLDARLFDRTAYGYRLTTAGNAIRDLAEAMEASAVAIERRISGQEAELRGPVSVGTTEGLGSFCLAPALPAFREQYPEIGLELRVGVTVLDLVRREADIVLRVGNPGCEELIGRRIGCVKFGLFAAESYLAEHGGPHSLADLAGHRIIESAGQIADVIQAQRLRNVAACAEVALRCDTVLTQFNAMRSGLGIAALPYYVVPPGARDIRRLLPQAFDLERDLWLLTHRDLRQSARIRAVLGFLAKTAKDWTPLLMGEASQ